ncbi:MAG: tRNA (adenosine(37)-N6)-threonylcarbamoyltransferase complex dimerization subunit type 1 TsaB [Chlamydiales bacterium]|nr:tRNA (adenosine(37)-N6)-threonylcarbamoyltransferase complex dimerization subunit type 1 TsaB [Chlamydiia bacterium]MCP5507602.1 tRNA (adenosine(37)-N6)-threonylcarbamoyltransferase complex dimerization subunit type 1 TsaB [Chlamydiales bacterium]
MVALMEGNEILFHEELPYGYNNSKYLLPQINNALDINKIQANHLNFIAAGIGPGSYTGIRVGAVTAMTMAYAATLPLVGISTLKCFVPTAHGSFAVLIDAKISGAYYIIGSSTPEGIIYDSDPAVDSLEVIKPKLHDIDVIVTPNDQSLKGKVDINLPWEVVSPSPEHMGRQALNLFNRGEYSKNATLDLQYLRKTQAEIEREENSGV